MILRNKVFIWTTAALSAVAIGAVIAEFTYDAPMVKACESAIQKRLRSPSSYKRINISKSYIRETASEYKAYIEKQDSSEFVKDVRLRDLEKNGPQRTHYTLLIEYDASNAYGAAIRDIDECAYTGESDRDAKDYFDVTLNGKSHIDWLKSALQK